MRIIAGIARGIRLTAPKGRDTRPTADRVRESIFATLGNLDGFTVVDLYAGTGALGLEALSRGATHATFVESNRQTVKHLERNIQTVLRQWTQNPKKPTATIVATPVERAIARLLQTGQTPDIVFADPPYRDQQTNTPTAAYLLNLRNLATAWPHAWLVLEHESHAALPWHPESSWTPIRQKSYGNTTVTIAQAIIP